MVRLGMERLGRALSLGETGSLELRPGAVAGFVGGPAASALWIVVDPSAKGKQGPG